MGKFDIDIEIKDLLWEFVRRWRTILVVAILCGVGLTAYQYRADSNKTDVVTVKKSQAELEAAMGAQDLDEVTAAVALKRQLDQKSAYMETSVRMQINPYEENATFLQYYVSADTDSVAEDAAGIYTSYIENAHLTELVCVQSTEDILLIDTENTQESMRLSNGNAQTNRSFVVKIIGTTPEEVQTLAEEVQGALQEYSRKVNEKVGAHQLQLVDMTSCVIVDHALAELQNRNATAIKTISNNLDKMKNEMTSDQISLYVYRTTTLADNQTSSTTTVISAPKATIRIKYTVIGIVVGMILACGVIFVSYLFAATLRNSKEVELLYQIKLLGDIDDTGFKKKRVFEFADAFIRKLQNKRRKAFTYEQQIQMICSKIVIGCQQNGRNEIVLTSSILQKLPETVKDDIVKSCKEKGIQVTLAKELSYDAKALEKAVNIGSVVFVEGRHQSLYEELYKEIALCKENHVEVLGMVVLGA